MLNINQNFDLKAPVFNFDRDYFNSVEELNAYDTSNVPDHFVTNVGGMLYQFTKPWQWKPIIGTGDAGPDKHDINLGCTNAKINIVDGFPRYMSLEDEDGSVIRLMPGILDIYGITNHQNITINADGNETGGTISIYGNDSTETRIASNIISCGDRRSFNVRVYGDEGRVEAQKKDGSFTSYGSNGFSGQTKDETKSYSLNIPSDDDENGEVSLSLKNADCSTKLSTDSGLTVTSDEGFTTNINNQSFSIQVFNTPAVTLDANTLLFSNTNNTTALKLNASNGLILGNDDKVKFSRPTNTEGGVISGIKSLTAFANPSATKVWATDGSTVDLTTKANTSDLDAKANASDVLLKKSATGGYYIEDFTSGLGNKAFITNKYCAALSDYSYAEGNFTRANATCSHAEGANSIASGYAAHAQGTYNIDNINAIHSVGIGNATTRKNAEYIYAKNNTNGTAIVDDPKNGYKYLIGVGGYDGISTDNTTYKSVQEVIADLTARIEQLETKVKALEAANAPA